MSYFLKNKYIIMLIMVTVVVFGVMILTAVESYDIPVASNVVSFIMTPFQKFFYGISSNIQGFAKFIYDAKNYKQENEQLKQQLDRLMEQNRLMTNLEDENNRLREMLDLKSSFNQFEIIGTQIIAKDPSNWFDIFTIDKGTLHGLTKKSAVITGKGLVGYINEINPSSSKVMSIIDSDSSVSGLVVRTRDNMGIVVKGDLSLQREGLCKMVNIPKESDIISGDLIETSGLGGIYPKGLLIGRVIEVKPETLGFSKYAVVQPAVDFKRLEEVFVIKNILE